MAYRPLIFMAATKHAREAARRFERDLKAAALGRFEAGIDVFCAQLEHLFPDDASELVILRALRDADLIVVLVSPDMAASASPWWFDDNTILVHWMTARPWHAGRVVPVLFPHVSTFPTEFLRLWPIRVESGGFSHAATEVIGHLPPVRGAPPADSSTHAPLSGALRPPLIEVPPGDFEMGNTEMGMDARPDERPRRVRIEKPYLMAMTPVTIEHYTNVVGGVRHAHADSRLPVTEVSFFDAIHYCNSLSIAEDLPPTYIVSGRFVFRYGDKDGYRLPTEAEWEYACRAGTYTPFSCGRDARRDLVSHAWFAWNSGGRLQPVATRNPNLLHLCDMHGNVREWVEDFYAAYPGEAVTEPVKLFEKTNERVIRGGSFRSGPDACRSYARDCAPPQTLADDLGFRIVCRRSRGER